MFVPTRDVFDLCCRDDLSTDPVRAVELLGRMGPLGRIWLRSEIVAAADRFVGAAEMPRLPLACGEFRVLLLTPARDRYAALRPAFALPLRWIAGEADSPALPPGLAAAAASLITRHSSDVSIQPPKTGRWALHLGGGLAGQCDFSQFDFGCEWGSAAAALLGGLQLASLDAAPNEEVMASVVWGERGIGGVDGVSDKLNAARDTGARLVFLAASEQAESQRWHDTNPGSSLRTVFLEPRSTLRESLAPFLQAIEAPPESAAHITELRRFYETRLLSRDQVPERRRFWFDVLVDRLASDYSGPFPLAGPCRNLIGVVGPGAAPPLAFLARVLAPQRVLLLHDTQAAEHAAALLAHLAGARGIDAKTHRFNTLFGPLDELRPEVELAISQFLGADPVADGVLDTVIDLTGGTRRLPFILIDVAPSRAVCVHVDAERVSGQTEKIGTEKIVTIDLRRAGR